MAAHSNILAWKIPKDGGAWWASLWGCKELDTTRHGITEPFSGVWVVGYLKNVLKYNFMPDKKYHIGIIDVNNLNV